MNKTNLSDDELIQDFLESVGATEKDILKLGNRAVDLSTIPQSEHHLYGQRDVAVPPEVWAVLETFEYPLTIEQARMVEKMMDEFHDIAKPYGIDMSRDIYETGEPDQTCELVKQGFVTGFTYLHIPLDKEHQHPASIQRIHPTKKNLQ